MFQRLLSVGIPVWIGTQVTSGHAVQKPQKPGPEHQRLKFFVGRWQVEGEVASGKFKATSTCEWFEGHFHVVCRSDATTPEGNSKTLEVLTYDTSSGAYTHYNIGSLRESSLFSTGKLEGKRGAGTLSQGQRAKSMTIGGPKRPPIPTRSMSR
jgi:Protein of unknown function (DUF1579)